MENNVFFPYGISNFEELVRDGFVFVDKTKFIEKLEYAKEKRVSFLRPRRFGKSLWLSVLEYYYDINQKHKFDKIFGRYYIGQNPTSLQGSYRILKFDFSGINTETRERAIHGFNSNIQTTLDGFFKFYGCFSQEEQTKISNEIHAEEKIGKFFKFYPKDIPLYLLFDEYDHFTNEILYRSKEEFIDSVSKQGYIRKFYEVIKTATQSGVVDRIFITGVSPVTLDSLTSGFNIITHLSHSEHFETMMGFTEDEVRELLRLVLQDKNREEEIIQEMRKWYNGYRFYRNSKQNIYNSDMVLYYFKHFKHYQESPTQMLDPNIAPDYGKLKQMFRVVNLHENEQVLKEVLEHGSVSAPLVVQFNFERGFSQSDFINFLAYMGNLTIEGVDLTGELIFKIPNKVIEVLYWQYYADVLNEQVELQKQGYDLQNAVRKMAKFGEYEAFFELIEQVLKGLSNRDFIKFNEKQVKMVIIAYLMLADIFDVISERELGSGGYPDLMLFKKSSNPYNHHEFLIELKYLKKEDENELSKMQEEAKTQLLRYYEQDKTLHSKPMLHLLTVVAIKDELHVTQIN